jgi:hypothetical protein
VIDDENACLLGSTQPSQGMTQKKAEPRAFDLSVGERAFGRLLPALRAMSDDEIVAVNMDAQEAAVVALALVDIAREPARHKLLQQLMPSFLAADTVEQLELAAWTTWYAHAQLQSEQALAKAAKVDAATYEESGRLLAKMLRLIEYHVGDRAEVAKELADIRSGTGYQDRASDLVRAASLFERFESELEGDTRHYDRALAREARRYAQQIVENIRASLGTQAAEWLDLRSRAYSRMLALYGELQAAGDFVFRRDPVQRELFTTIRRLIVPSRRPAKQTPPADNPPAQDSSASEA